MSKRRVRSRNKTKCEKSKQRTSGTRGTSRFMTVYPLYDPETGEVDLQTYCFDVKPEDMASVDVYNNAHELMPYGYSYDPIVDRVEVDRAVAVLEQPDAGENELLRAIAILGHSPCAKALEALNRCSSTVHRYAAVARIALGECSGMVTALEERDRPSEAVPSALN